MELVRPKFEFVRGILGRIPVGLPSIYVTGEWRHLLFFNFTIDPKILRPFIPAGMELDLYRGKAYVSLVALVFKQPKILGTLPIPFSTRFEQINLRFYVKRKNTRDSRPGVVFLREYVPSIMQTIFARLVLGEHYRPAPIRSYISEGRRYTYRWKGSLISASTQGWPKSPEAGSEAKFLTERNWSYTKAGPRKTYMTHVEHPQWVIREVGQYFYNVDTKRVFGRRFAPWLGKPVSVFVAHGSHVKAFMPNAKAA